MRPELIFLWLDLEKYVPPRNCCQAGPSPGGESRGTSWTNITSSSKFSVRADICQSAVGKISCAHSFCFVLLRKVPQESPTFFRKRLSTSLSGSCEHCDLHSPNVCLIWYTGRDVLYENQFFCRRIPCPSSYFPKCSKKKHVLTCSAWSCCAKFPKKSQHFLGSDWVHHMFSNTSDKKWGQSSYFWNCI